MTTAAPSPARRNNDALIFGVLFTLLAVSGIGLLAWPPFDKAVIVPFNESLASISVWLINLVDSNVVAAGRVLRFLEGPGAVAVANGCNAVEVCILMTAAMLAYPARLSDRIFGALVCVAAVQALNIVRIISLLYLARLAPEWFDFFHSYVWDALILLDGVLIFFLWLRHANRRLAAKAAQATA